MIAAAQANIAIEIQTIQQLSEVASKQPYYRFNYAWTKQIEASVCINVDEFLSVLTTFQCFSILLCGWLGGFSKQLGQLLTIEEVGAIMQGM